MPVFYGYQVRLIDENALNKFLLSKGLVPRSLKWSNVRSRHAHKFLKD